MAAWDFSLASGRVSKQWPGLSPYLYKYHLIRTTAALLHQKFRSPARIGRLKAKITDLQFRPVEEKWSSPQIPGRTNIGYPLLVPIRTSSFNKAQLNSTRHTCSLMEATIGASTTERSKKASTSSLALRWDSENYKLNNDVSEIKDRT